MSNKNNFGEDMGMEDFQSMFEESLKQPTRGSTVRGTVAQINGNDVIVNINGKKEGVIERSELPEDLKEGDDVGELIVIEDKIGDYVKLSKRNLTEFSDSASMKDLVGTYVKVKILSHTDKGFRGKANNIDVFIPLNHIDLKSSMKAPEDYVGKVLDAKVLKAGGSSKYKSLLASPKEFITDQANKVKKDFIDKIEVGDIVKGIVKNIKEYGAFISIGAIDGFLHRSNISWGRPRNPSKMIKEGDQIEVKIIDVDAENSKIEVGLKHMMEDPWSTAKDKYPLDSIVKASVIGRRRNGYITEIEPGIDAFIPLEEISWLKNTRISINSKDIVEGRVLGYNDENKRVIISVRLMEENPWKVLSKDFPEGSVVEGTIKNVTDFGIFIDFGQFVDGLIRKGDISWTQEPEDLNAIYKPGDKVTAKILKIDDEKERVSLGIKQLTQNPWRSFNKDMKNKVQTVKVISTTKNGIIVELDNGIRGEIPSNELDPQNSSLDNFKEGDEITATILRIEPKDRQVILSIRKLISDAERKETKEYMKKLENSNEGNTFGAIFKDKLNK